ncbi:hypothetical protein [Brumimicrobium aurantiacum]|uniref:DUF3157 family protein n=1 Tax=Brumimicrobium aurantiacum TaxID=1737063 RepID=A0A3E1EYU5_9FLAO|nr:hypothetical protein [Brumimicrobium aurantiacum]RFC54735.1 hypothetical protein DXU93_07050 [Brumimicrobium aurantiacum]
MNIKNLLSLTSIFCLIGLTSNAQTTAVTEDGDTIYVYQNGTWSFDKDEVSPIPNHLSFMYLDLDIDTLSTPFTTPKSAKSKVSNDFISFDVNYNNDLWKRVPPATLNDDAEFGFQSKEHDIWSIVISEETTIAPDDLFRIAKNSMEENTGSEVEILKTEHRTINGTPIIRATVRASFSGITFIFDSYYYSNENGSVQFTTWTSDKIWKRNENVILDLMNGFVVQK